MTRTPARGPARPRARVGPSGPPGGHGDTRGPPGAPGAPPAPAPARKRNPTHQGDTL